MGSFGAGFSPPSGLDYVLFLHRNVREAGLQVRLPRLDLAPAVASISFARHPERMETVALTHVAMAVLPGTLSDDYCKAIQAFYGEVFGWRELADLRQPGRLTIAIGARSYINIREHESATALTYEHFGVLVRSATTVTDLREMIVKRGVDAGAVEEPVPGHPTFRFQHLLPMAIEVQYLP